jgi:hypothetical protein
VVTTRTEDGCDCGRLRLSMLSPSSAAAPGPHGGTIGPSGSMGCSRLVTGPTIDLKWAVAHVYLDEDIIDREQTEESYNGLGRPLPLGSFYTQPKMSCSFLSHRRFGMPSVLFSESSS